MGLSVYTSNRDGNYVSNSHQRGHNKYEIPNLPNAMLKTQKNAASQKFALKSKVKY
jgi:hypothetical protein